MSDKNVKKQNSDCGKKWFENNKIFLLEDKISEMEYLHEYLGNPVTDTQYHDKVRF